ncbi:MAG: methyltransferase domain-containing protein [Alphaproteobacteria bacterium]|jgi:ubiquinone/menaquinone biosynthesis C-methylase UbiE|nr:methyltransferase domain-containing protein [Alphaproteobacteria bacterium]
MQSYDPIWDEIYEAGGQLNRYPFSSVVTFLYRHAPRDRARADIRILEIGCGAGNNLWFAAREGFDVTGLDGSDAAMDFARKRFAEEGLQGEFVTGDFTDLPFADDSFDIVLERGAVSMAPTSAARKAVEEAARVLRPGGLMYAEIYSDRATTRGRKGDDGVLLDTEGPFSGVGQITLYGMAGVADLFEPNFEIINLSHQETIQTEPRPIQIFANWNIICKKAG